MQAEGGSEARKHHSHCHTLETKKLSFPGEKRKLGASNFSLMRRSNSCLSSASMTTSEGYDEAENRQHQSYLTPTQRKNQEIKRLRLELEKTKKQLISRENEILTLKQEVAALQESQQSIGEPFHADSESVTDSGNCEEIVTKWDASEVHLKEVEDVEDNDNIDFEIMESTLREEEDYRQNLEDDNRELQNIISNLRDEIKTLRECHIEEVFSLKKCQDKNISIATKEIHQKVEELIVELAESSMRCARQQDTIEKRQLKIDELLKENNNNKDYISKLKEVISEIKAKEDQRNNCSKSEEYLKSISYVETLSKQCQVEPCKMVGITQTDQKYFASDSKETKIEFVPMSDVCDDKIHFTYQFLRRAIYYYITDKDNRAYHLKSIQRLLEFSDAELSTMNLTKAPQNSIKPIKRY